MAGYELATAYVNLVSSTGGLGKQIGRQFGDVQKAANRAGAQSGQSFAKAFTASKPIDVREDVKRAAANVEIASGRVKKARQTEESASRKVKIAEAELNELREKGDASASDLLKAEDKLANAKSRHEVATLNVTDAEEAASKATSAHKSAVEAADKALQAGGNSSNVFANKVKGAFKSFHANAVAQVDIVGEKIKSGFSTASKVAGGAVAAIFGAAVVKGWGRLTAIENAQAKLKGLGNSAKDVDVIMDNALASVKGTAFGLDEAATTAAGAVAAGIKPGQELEGVLTSVANSAATAGMGMDEMGGIYNKVASIGKAQNDVLQQVADRGIPIYQSLADQLGVTTDEVFKMASEGKIGFEEFESAMSAASGTVADEMGKTTTGALANLWAALGRFGAGLLEGVFPVIGPLFTDLTEKLDGLAEVVGPVAEEIGVKLVNGIKAVVEWFQQWWPVLAPVVAGFVAFIGTLKAITLATQIYAGAIWLVNAAMAASPIAWVVGLIALLVTAFVLAYNKVDWFRNAVDAAWAGIKFAVGAVVEWFQTVVWPTMVTVWDAIANATIWLYQNAILPAWNGIKTAVGAVVGWFQTYVAPVISAAIDVVGAIFKWLYDYVVKPVFTGIKIYIQVWWTVVSAIFNAVVSFVKNYLNPVFQLLWAVVKVVFSKIKEWIAAAWNATIKPIWNAIVSFINNWLVPRFNFLKTTLQAVWAAIRAAIKTAWNTYMKPVFDAIVAFVKNHLQTRFNALKSTVTNVWNGIKSSISTVWNFIRDKVFDPLKNAIKNSVPDAFEKGKDAIGKAWDKVRDVAKKPVKFVVNTIINKGIIDNFNKIADTFGVDKMPSVKLPKGFDRGGWTGPGARLQPAGVVHADEFVVKKSSRKRFERQNPGVLDHINRTGNLPMFGGYAGGGRVWQNLWRINKDEFPNSRLTSSVRNSTTVSGNKSMHASGMAIDVAGPRPGDKSAMLAIANWWRANYGAKLAELIHTPLGNKQIKNGSNYTYAGAVARQHHDHVHIAARKALDGKGGLSGSGGGGVFDFLNPFKGLLDKIKSKMPGSGEFKELIAGGAKKMVQMPIDWISEKASAIADFAGDVGTAVKDVVTTGTGRARGKKWAVAQGWPLFGGKRWKALDYIVSRESSWNPKAKNPRSTASGLGQFINATARQFLGGAPMSKFPFDDQLAAVVKYADSRYGGLGKAMAFWKKHHYYDTGGRVTSPTVFDTGGVLGPGTHLVQNATRKPEYILPADVTDRLLDGRGAGKGGDTYNVYGRNTDEIVREIELKQRKRELLTTI